MVGNGRALIDTDGSNDDCCPYVFRSTLSRDKKHELLNEVELYKTEMTPLIFQYQDSSISVDSVW